MNVEYVHKSLIFNKILRGYLRLSVVNNVLHNT